MRGHFSDVRTRFFAAHAGNKFSVSIDSGTNSGVRTLNLTMRVACTSRILGAMRIEVQSADQLVLFVTDALKEPLSNMQVVGFISDNAANVRSACATLAANMNAQVFSCACHAINKVVEKVAYTWEAVELGRTACDKARVQRPTLIPQEIMSRWNPAYEACEAVIKHAHLLAYENILEVSDVAKVEVAKKCIDTLYFESRRCESDTATIFDAAVAFSLAFNGKIAADIAFPEIFARNCYHESLVCACLLSPAGTPEAFIPPIRRMVIHAMRTCLATIDCDFSERRFDAEMSIVMDGGLQRIFRIKKYGERPSIREFWGCGETPLVFQLVEQLLELPASSANVERSFSEHARCHTTDRTMMSEDSVNVQLGLHSFLKPTSQAKPNNTIPEPRDVDNVLSWCFFGWTSDRVKLLKEGESVTVFFTDPRTLKQTGYRGKLLSQDGAMWRVKWISDKENRQRFNPLLDPWLLTAEMP